MVPDAFGSIHEAFSPGPYWQKVLRNWGLLLYRWLKKAAKSWMLVPVNPMAELKLARQPRNLLASHCPGSGNPTSAPDPESS